jgi:HNH endonuclease
MSKDQIIETIKELGQKLGRYPSMPELNHANPAIKMGSIRKHFAGYGEALRAAGFEGTGFGYTVALDDLFRDWARLARKLQKVPSMAEYERDSRYSVRPMLGRFRSWSQAPRGLYRYAEQKGLDVEYGDVLDIIKAHYEGKPEAAWMSEEIWPSAHRDIGPSDQNGQNGQIFPIENIAATVETGLRGPGLDATTLDPRRWEAREFGPRKAPVLPDRPFYGPPMVDAALACGPTNENGVIYMFGMFAARLGFVVTRIQTEFPDCEAFRYVGEGRWQRVRIEFEYESRNFVKHMHDPHGCDLIVCWAHNWKECPVEVIELKELARAISREGR